MEDNIDLILFDKSNKMPNVYSIELTTICLIHRLLMIDVADL